MSVFGTDLGASKLVGAFLTLPRIQTTMKIIESLAAGVLIVLALPLLMMGSAADVGMTKRCKIHDTALLTVTGSVPDKDAMVSPTIEYGMFISEFRDHYPHKTPWWFSQNADEGSDKRESAEACPKCDQEFKNDYDWYLKLDEPERERRWSAYLRTHGTKLPSIDLPDSECTESKTHSPLPPLPTQ